MDERLASRHIVLLGVGHTNAHIVRMWGMNPIRDADLTCLSDNAIATYSGMLPAVLAGQIPPADMQIDLVKLCSSVGARLITDAVTGLDKDRRRIHFAERPAIPFDVLSVGIGSIPSVDGVQIEGTSLLKIKPMQTFLERLSAAVNTALENAGARELRIVVAGSGVAGTEIAFCLPSFIRRRTKTPFSLQIVTRSNEILPGVLSSMRRKVHAELKRCSVPVTVGKAILRVTDSTVELDDGTKLDADLVIWATGAAAPELLGQLGLPLDDRGFLATDDTLRSTSGTAIFAVGDSGTIISAQLPKAGVYAVRQGPFLWDNTQRLLAGRSLLPYRPQRTFLKLLNTGDGRAIGEWKRFSFGGRWVMRLKDFIDSKFMKMYRVSGEMMGAAADSMQCRGCGCKLGGEVLEGALTAVGIQSSDATQSAGGLDDAAVIETAGGQIVASTDFFSSPVDDPYLAGRIAALHSASDLVAMGAGVTAALANVVVPDGDPQTQRQGLNDLLAGASHEFTAMGAKIVGGHTIVGSRWEIGFTVIGEPLSQSLLRKQNLKTGDLLYVTKPLGIGVLLAAQMRSQCDAADYAILMDAMLQRQHGLSRIAAELNITAGTDITGFGLVGHLVEMLQASGKSATVNLAQLPLLPGTAAAIDAGIESTLAPANRHVECRIQASPEQRSQPAYRVLFDPQTCGGLLLGVPISQAEQLERLIDSADTGIAARIGEVCDADAPDSLVRIV